jgi:protein-disulfide isomerase
MGLFETLFGKKKVVVEEGELLVPCANTKCHKIFKEWQGMKPNDTVSQFGLNDFRCPYCKEKFTLNREKIVANQEKLRKKLKDPHTAD